MSGTEPEKQEDNEWKCFWIGMVVLLILLAGIVLLPLALFAAGVIVLLKNMFTL